MRTTEPNLALQYWKTNAQRIDECIAMLQNVLHDKDLFVVKRITGSYITNDPVQRYTDSISDDAVRLFTEIEAEIVCNSCNYMAKAKMFKTVNYKTELHNQRNTAGIMVQVQAVRVKLTTTANHIIEFWQ